MAKHEMLARRRLLGWSAAGAAALLCPDILKATPEVRETEDNIEGPFYKPGAPERDTLLEKDQPGTRLTLTGRVLSTKGMPLSGALLDVWQTNAAGEYDNEGFKMRGRLYADSSGNYRLNTILPRYYKAGGTIRPAHIHVKVSAPGFPLLTTQLYFKGDPHNGRDRYVRRSLMIDPAASRGGVQPGAFAPGVAGKTATFDFVLRGA